MGFNRKALCPLLSIAVAVKAGPDGKSGGCNCVGDKCAWWVEFGETGKGKCIMYALNGIEFSTRTLQKAGTADAMGGAEVTADEVPF